MNGDITTYVLCGVIAYLVLCILLQNREHRKTVDKLTDKLMARSYTEYKSAQNIKEDDVSPEREDEPKSWHDH
jgi:mannitol/fructose-specific phosphotransferase system IIA component